MATGLETIRDLIDRSTRAHRQIHSINLEPGRTKELFNRFSITEVSAMVGRTPQAIRRAENQGDLESPRRDEKGRREGYTLTQVNKIRDHFGTRKRRSPEEKPAIVAVQNFKGGVAKSTLAVHLAQYLALQGYRVLIVDCDPQASTTRTFGYLPDEQLAESDTLLPYLRQEGDLVTAIRPTYWEGLDLIPANLRLYQAEYELASDIYQQGGYVLHLLKRGLAEVEDKYDVIVLDPPPALGFIALNVMFASNSLLIPAPPTMYDFTSTISFLNMLNDNLASIERHMGASVDYQFVRIVISRYRGQLTAQSAMAELMQNVFGHYLLPTRFKESSEIQSASNQDKTVYELTEPTTSAKRTYLRATAMLEAVMRDIELQIRMTWPSHRKQLQAEGRL
ncbi:AAA family ATPase [Thioalkalivibrio thiocyanodenitrificans]|uniref:AAA family ATPase n=1 Tax=Thioalkalivibrio thiocyanodenitrificans TaxID=243063 RepID=UPI000372DB56|nr:AAA family ATPase [Thioalkalivibrio thiocyanodenitrificans]